MEAKRSGLRFSLLVLVAVGVILTVLVWWRFRQDVPLDAAVVLGHPIPAGATALGTDRFTTGLLGQNGIDRAVVEMEEEQFEQYRKDAGYTPLKKDPGVFGRDGSKQPWWDIANLKDSPMYHMERKDAGGTTSYYYVKYEKGRAYAVRSFYAPR